MFLCKKIVVKRKEKNYYCRQIKNKKDFLEKVKTSATELQDVDMLQKIQEEMNLEDNRLCYHNFCSLEHFKKFQTKINRPPTNEWAIKRECHQASKAKLIAYVEYEIVQNLP